MVTSNWIHTERLANRARMLRDGEEPLRAMLNHFQDRFKEIEPRIQAFLPKEDRFRQLREEAAELEATYPDALARPPLYGILVGIKDIFHVEGFETFAGTEVPPEVFAGPESAVVTKLKEAGALIMGKTVTTEFAFLEPGPTRNPYDLKRTPGGSSSGSAAAVATGMVPLAIGTQTVGSTIRPAAYCGIVGFKPSFGRIDPTGVVFFSRSADHVGLFAQDVAGMHLAASAVIDNWQEERLAPEKPVLAVPEGAYLQQANALEAFEAQVQALIAAGYVVKRIPLEVDIDALKELHLDMIAAEVAQEHAGWFGEYEHLYRPQTAEIIRRGQGVSEERLEEGRNNRLTLREHLESLMRDNGIDAWISPAATGEAPLGLHTTGDSSMNLPWTHAGLPAVTVPAGVGDAGMPLGLQICAAFNMDEALLQWSEYIGEEF
ncbi:amidase [Phototrophicus methaneseepsis]|uniref:Amidase n=1 Tax=Phototrophicus methaneseepsis TaxID=2710758 RepID=A0A7S8IFE2_9CHLR|nr:amidase [Phototrophicus methaneseepsis]QPC83399.1 amidase [Phototrophicus methaneseepsis]